MESRVKENSGSIGFFSVLTIVFIVLKLTGHIDWSWFWVLSPTLIPLIIVLLGVLIPVTIILIEKGIRKIKNK